MSKKLAYTLLVTALVGGVSAPASAAPATAGSVGSSPPASEAVAAPVAADLAPADAPSANPSEPAPLLRHDPIDSAKANEPLLIVAHWAAPSRTPPQVFLHYRRAGQSVFHTTPLGIRDTTTLEATIPAADLLSGTIEYYLGSKPHADSAAPEQLHFGSPQWPHAVAVVVEGSERTQRALLAQHLGDRSQFQVSGMYIDRGLRTVLNKSRTAQFDMRDYYYRLEGDYTYRILSVVHSIRIGGGVIRGDSFTFNGVTAAQPLPTQLDNVGLTYGFAEVRFRFGKLVRMDLRATLGAGPSHFDGGGGGQILVGYDPGTHLALGFDGVSSVGIRAWLRLTWNTVPRVPMSFTLEASNLPIGEDVGGLVYLTAGYRFNRYASFDLNIGYAHRDQAVGGPIAGGALRLEF